jgi:4-hydroxythreonine-4-phosphate dehydrogenase
MGDPAGVGGEIILKALPQVSRRSVPVIVGDLRVIDQLASTLYKNRRIGFKPLGKAQAGEAEFLDLDIITQDVRFGSADPLYGHAAHSYILEALKLTFLNDVSAIVTCPISKKSINLAAIPFMGHTELLAHYGGVADYVMMMAAGRFRVSLATIHIPLRDVPDEISSEKVFTCIALTDASLKQYFRIAAPYIKVCGLNPHAGEQGVIGDEEERIEEAVTKARSLGINVEGPFPADSLFHRIDCDAYIAMYHDQALIPVKTRDFPRTVNITLGLPFIRTSVGHGTGFDIAGAGKADPTSFIEAYRTAERMLSATV